MSSILSEDNKDDLLTKFSSTCSQIVVPTLEKIHENISELKISSMRIINNRIVLEILGIIIYDNMIFDTVDSYKMKKWISFLIKVMKDSFSYNEAVP
jgi:hypothetical protein